MEVDDEASAYISNVQGHIVCRYKVSSYRWMESEAFKAACLFCRCCGLTAEECGDLWVGKLRRLQVIHPN